MWEGVRTSSRRVWALAREGEMQSCAEQGRSPQARAPRLTFETNHSCYRKEQGGTEIGGGCLPPAPGAPILGKAALGWERSMPQHLRPQLSHLCYLWQPWLRNYWEGWLCLSPSSTQGLLGPAERWGLPVTVGCASAQEALWAPSAGHGLPHLHLQGLWIQSRSLPHTPCPFLLIYSIPVNTTETTNFFGGGEAHPA